MTGITEWAFPNHRLSPSPTRLSSIVHPHPPIPHHTTASGGIVTGTLVGVDDATSNQRCTVTVVHQPRSEILVHSATGFVLMNPDVLPCIAKTKDEEVDLMGGATGKGGGGDNDSSDGDDSDEEVGMVESDEDEVLEVEEATSSGRDVPTRPPPTESATKRQRSQDESE